MKQLVAFFEIPAKDFHRAVKFYQTILGNEMPVMECKTEKMAFFMVDGQEESVGAISCVKGFEPSGQGVLIHFHCPKMEATLALIESNGGRIITPKTKIEAEGRGYFSLFADSEGNRIGLYSAS